MITMIRARNPKTDDTEILRLIQTELLPLSYSVHPLDAQVIRELPKRFRWGHTYVAAAGKTSEPYGFIHFEITGNILYLDMLVIHPHHRNRNWGKRLMASCEGYGQAHQCIAARLFVDEINTKALHFYTRLGYHITRYYPDLKCYEMIKPLPLAQPALND